MKYMAFVLALTLLSLGLSVIADNNEFDYNQFVVQPGEPVAGYSLDLNAAVEDPNFFGLKVTSGYNIFITDRSGSMTCGCYMSPPYNNRWEMASTELKTTIDNLKNDDSANGNPNALGLLFFNSDVTKQWGFDQNGGLTPVDDNSKGEAKNTVDTQSPGGSTNYSAPLKMAVDRLANMGAGADVVHKEIFFLADGEPNTGPLWGSVNDMYDPSNPSTATIYGIANYAKSNDIKISVIYCGTSNSSLEQQMQKIAELTDGQWSGPGS